MRTGLLLVLIAFASLAGCTQGPGAVPTPDLDFPAIMEAATTPVETFEYRGEMRVAWSGDLFGVYAEAEDSLHRWSVLTPAVLYTSDFGMGWVERGLDGLEDASLSSRYLLWDLPRLAAEAEQVTATADGYRFEGHTRYGGEASSYVMEVQVEGAQVVRAQVNGDAGYEAPYEFTTTDAAMPFPVKVPRALRTEVEVDRLDDEARDGHAQIVEWVKGYEQATGALPTSVDPQTLFVQRLGADWPQNPYSGQAVKDATTSGDFDWYRCSDDDAIYLGYGWDGGIFVESFGVGCAPEEMDLKRH